MSIITVLEKIIEESREIYESIPNKDALNPFEAVEISGEGRGGNLLVNGDNLDIMEFLRENKGLAGKIQMIYIDPPFLTGTDYGTSIKLNTGLAELVPTIKQRAYNDNFDKGLEGYLRMLTPRLFAMKDLLAEEGSIFVHLDWRTVHYVKVIMDEIFGEKNFVNEIIWHYKSGGASSRRFARKHDNILYYSKGPKYYFQPEKEKSYNRGFKPYRFKGVKEYRDEKGWYTMVNRKDVWELDMVGRTSAERTGYVTQKPESLLERMIVSTTKEGDLCADFFGGSATMAATAEKLGRKWISCDIGKPAIISSIKRLVGEDASFTYYQRKEPTRSIECRVRLEEDPMADKPLLRVELESYDLPDLATIPVAKKHLPYVEKALKADSLQFIAYWAIDLNYDGKVFKPDKYMLRSDSGLESLYESLVDGPKPLCVSGMDIFGNRFEAVWSEDRI